MESKKDFLVDLQDTAAVLGSGGLAVLATPRLVAMVENTCWEALEPTLDKGFTTVGTKFSIDHLKPSPVGATITVLIQWEKEQGFQFDYQVTDGSQQLIAKGTHQRAAVEISRFMKKVNENQS